MIACFSQATLGILYYGSNRLVSIRASVSAFPGATRIAVAEGSGASCATSFARSADEDGRHENNNNAERKRGKSSWTEKEKLTLLHVAEEQKRKGATDWGRIASLHFGGNKSAKACSACYYRLKKEEEERSASLLKMTKKGNSWTEQEKRTLFLAVKRHHDGGSSEKLSWKEIASRYFGGRRSTTACYEFYRKHKKEEERLAHLWLTIQVLKLMIMATFVMDGRQKKMNLDERMVQRRRRVKFNDKC